MMKTVAFVQARTGSSRLPGKVMYPLAGGTVLSRVVERTRSARSLDEVIVATTSSDRDTVIADQAEEIGAGFFRGDEADVMGRLYNAAERSGADIVVRVCGDNPLVAPRCIDAAVGKVTEGADYASTALERTMPIGVGAEAFSFESFSRAESDASNEADREHVTLWYKRNPDEFTLENVSVDDVYSSGSPLSTTDLRLTLDTAEDYQLLREVYGALPRSDRGIVDTESAVRYVVEHDLAGINRHVEQRNPLRQ